MTVKELSKLFGYNATVILQVLDCKYEATKDGGIKTINYKNNRYEGDAWGIPIFYSERRVIDIYPELVGEKTPVIVIEVSGIEVSGNDSI